MIWTRILKKKPDQTTNMMSTLKNLKKFPIVIIAIAVLSNACDSAEPVERIEKRDSDTIKVTQQPDSQRAANDKEWLQYKSEIEVRIKTNEVRIAQLKDKKANPGTKMDAYYTERIDALTQKNIDLKNRINNYDKNRSDWEAFKREFSHDMDDLGESLKNFAVDNKR